MGRADIAILSTISGGIRLCLHPGALCLGSAYDGYASFVLLRHVGTRRAFAISLAAYHARLSRYGVIRIVVLRTCGQKPRPTLTGLRYRWTARLGRARASAILSDSECCREMSFISNLSVFVHRIRRSALWSELSRLFCPCAACSGSSARSTVDFPRRCPFSVIFSGPFREEEFAVISRCFKSRCRDFAPRPL